MNTHEPVTQLQVDQRVSPNPQQGFNNNSTSRSNEPAAKLSWERTIAFFKKHLA